MIWWNPNCLCACSGSGAGPGAFGQAAQPPGSATPSPHQPVMGLAQAQTNNSNNKTAMYAGAAPSVSECSLPEDLHQLMEDWAQEVLIVTQRPHSNSLSISRKELWDQAVSHTHGRQSGDSEVGLLLHACKTQDTRAQLEFLNMGMGCYMYAVHLKQLKGLYSECSLIKNPHTTKAINMTPLLKHCCYL